WVHEMDPGRGGSAARALGCLEAVPGLGRRISCGARRRTLLPRRPRSLVVQQRAPRPRRPPWGARGFPQRPRVRPRGEGSSAASQRAALPRPTALARRAAARLHAAEDAAAAGRRSEADAELAKAQPFFEAAGAKLYLPRCEALLAAAS